MTTFTKQQRNKLEHYLATHDLPTGMGSEESACSIAAINLAISGKLTDDIPDCMSEVLGKATIVLQDAVPSEIRNSKRYKEWLPTAAGTGRDKEQERLFILMDWMWGAVLPELQDVADKGGYGAKWRTMCEERTADAADAAAYAAATATAAYAARAVYAARAAYTADAAAYAAAYAAARAADAAADADAAATAAARAADAADAAARAAARAAAYAAAYATAADADFWERVDPIGVLERMSA